MRLPKQLSWGRIAIYFILGLWSLVCFFPLYWLFITSFKNEVAITNGPVYLPFVDFWPEFKAWKFILFDAYENLLRRYFNSMVVAFSATIIAITFAALFIYGATRFVRTGFWQADNMLFAMLVTRLLSPVIIVLPIYLMANYVGLLDTIWVLVFVYSATNLPVALWLLRPVLGSKACEQEQAAYLDGASHYLILFNILLPMIWPRLLAVALLIFILCWNEYLFAVFLAGSDAMTLPPWMVGQLSMKEAQIGGEAEEWANLSAATVLMVAPLLVFANLTQKALSRFIKVQIN
jgi:multiple sugar transport system permease protein